MAYTEANPKLYNMAGSFVKFKKWIVEKHFKDGRVQREINLGKGTIEQRIQNFFRKYGDYVLIGMSMKFAETAARYTPPQIGKAYIDKRFYYRPIQDLTLLSKGGYPPYHATKADYKALRDGYKFRVLNTKVGHKKNEVYAYCKGINEAKRLSRIANRGLSRYSWGAAINNTKQDIENKQAQGEMPWNWNIYRATTLPPIFQRLASQSPSIKKYQWGSYDWYNDKNGTNKIIWTVRNRLTQIQRYGQLAIRQGLKVAKKYTEAIFKGINVVADPANKGSLRTEMPTDPDLAAVSKLRKQLIHMFDTVVDEYNVQNLEFTGGSSQPKNLPKHYKVNVNIKL